MDTHHLLEQLAAADTAATSATAPARLKARIYSALMTRLSESGPLRSLAETKATGSRLCVFEEVVAVLPVGEQLGSLNPCRVCHARVLGERLERAPIFWSGCPYAEFHKG